MDGLDLKVIFRLRWVSPSKKTDVVMAAVDRFDFFPLFEQWSLKILIKIHLGAHVFWPNFEKLNSSLDSKSNWTESYSITACFIMNFVK